MRTRPGRATALALAALLLAGCGGTGFSAPAASGSAAATAVAAGARDDLDRLLTALERIHPNPWHGVSRATFVAELTKLKGQLPTISSTQAMVGVMRLMALISRNGRDGHMFTLPVEGREGTMLPIRVYAFAEGWYVTDAMPPNRDLIGGRIKQLAGRPIGEVIALLEPLVPRDGPVDVPAFLPIFMLRVDVLRGLGLVREPPVAISVSLGGRERGVSLSPVPFAEYTSWAGERGAFQLPERAGTLYLSDEDDIFWTRYLADSRTLYARYTAVQGPTPDLVSRFISRATRSDVDRVVVDLRQNGGGENTSYGPLLRALQAPQLNETGRLFILADRLTFSAAANFCTELEQSTKATFVGEAMGGGLNFWDDVTWVTLPHFAIPLRVGISTRYWQKSRPDDPRLTIDPAIPVPVRASDYFTDRDPALAAALSAPSP